MNRHIFAIVLLALPSLLSADPADGILRKPIPDKLVILTFDDSCASHATIVAPVLKSLGFGGSFYIADFDCFHTRKDWYMTWRQMKALADDGFEVGNHTVGHGGGERIGNFLALEDELLANNVPKPDTICWPLYGVNSTTFPDLTANGYIFGRGGHERPYLPTVDNAFDVPSYTIRDGPEIADFVKHARLACDGRVVCFCFHGVPDGEHPSVGLDPETFKVMMHYLKDNHYKCIALRDMAEYVDTARAAMLKPPREVKIPEPIRLNDEEKPYVGFGKEIRHFEFPGLEPVQVNKTSITATVPYTADVSALVPKIELSAGATVSPAAGGVLDFSKPRNFIVTSKDGSTKTYAVTVKKAPMSRAKEILSFDLHVSSSVAISSTHIGAHVPASADVTALAPTFTLPPFATAVPASGTVRDFTKPQEYTITAQDGSTQICTVTVVKTDKVNTFTWTNAQTGKWSDGQDWSGKSAPVAAGDSNYAINLNAVGEFDLTNDLGDPFKLNQLVLASGQGHRIRLGGKSLAFTTDALTGTLPGIQLKSIYTQDTITAPIHLDSNLEIHSVQNGRLVIEGLISGPGALVVNGGHLRIENTTNSYTGGTIINAGATIGMNVNNTPITLGPGPITINEGGCLQAGGSKYANAVTMNGGLLEGNFTLDGPITLNKNVEIDGFNLNLNKSGGGISGPGGLTAIGIQGAFGRINFGTIYLWGPNTYAGPTVVHQGVLLLKRAVAVYNADATRWTAANLSVHPGAELVISTGGDKEFTGAQVGTLLTNLTASVDNNGLMSGAIVCIDVADPKSAAIVSGDITDSHGPGGGAYQFQKRGAGTLQLAGNNAYTGKTILEEGALSVASLNSVANGKPFSSLGTPTNIEDGEMMIGKKESDCALIYTGTGETSDRVMNLAGEKSNVTFDQSGTGLLKLTSNFAISGFGASKTIALKGDTAGTGEIAGSIANPYDRAGKATTAITKSGSGTWTLSGINNYSGPTTVKQGTLAIADSRALAASTDIVIQSGATLELRFKGKINIRSLSIGGKVQPPGEYGAGRSSGITGTGVLNVQQ